MSKLRIFILIVTIAVMGTAQNKILLCDFEPRGVTPEVAQIITRLLKDAINATYKYIAVQPEEGTKCYDVLEAINLAKKYGTDKVLIGNIVVIGTKKILSYQLIDALSSRIELASKTELPPVEEFPTMAERIAISIVEKKPYSQTVEIGKLTQPEIEPEFKYPRNPYTSIFVSAGYLYLLNKARITPEVPQDTLTKRIVNLNVATSFETKNLFTWLQIGLMRGKFEEKDINFDLTVNYVFGKRDFAPMAGVGMGITTFRWTDSRGDEHSTDGLSLSAGVGIIGLRTYYFRLMSGAYVNYLITNAWGNLTGFRIWFGITSPTMGPDAEIQISPGFVGAIIGGMFLTGLVIALTQ